MNKKHQIVYKSARESHQHLHQDNKNNHHLQTISYYQPRLEMKISYPTLKNRLDEVSVVLKRESAEFKRKRSDILDAIEKGAITPDEGAEQLESL